MRRERLRFKKTLFALERGRSDVARRRPWRSWQTALDPQRPGLHRRNLDQDQHGAWMGAERSPPSRLCTHGHWRTMTFLGALRHDRLAAPCLFDGPVNAECFRAYVEQLLLPSLKPGDIVIMDNLGSHKSVALRRIIKAAGARLCYLPPYSPDLNPI